jgi:hypothetical protein
MSSRSAAVVLALGPAAVFAAQALGRPSARAARTFHFKSPSGNINCGGAATSVTCLLLHNNWKTLRPRPASCDLDWSPTDMSLFLDSRTRMERRRRRLSWRHRPALLHTGSLRGPEVRRVDHRLRQRPWHSLHIACDRRYVHAVRRGRWRSRVPDCPAGLCGAEIIVSCWRSSDLTCGRASCLPSRATSRWPTNWLVAAKRSAVSKAGASGLEPATSGVTGVPQRFHRTSSNRTSRVAVRLHRVAALSHSPQLFV